MYRRSSYRRPYNSRYNAYVGRTTRSTPGIYRRPASGIRISRRLRVRRRGTNLKNQILSLQEKKYWDTKSTGATQLSNTGTIIDLSLVPQDSTDEGRIGDKLVINSIELNYTVYRRPEITLANPTDARMGVRIILFTWKDDTSPVPTNVLETVGTAIFEVDWIGPLDHDRKVKRKILYDKYFMLPTDLVYSYGLGTTYSSSNAVITKREFIDMKKMNTALRTINYESGSTTGVNKVYMLAIAENPVLGTAYDQPTIYYNVRLNFVDG